MKKRIDLSNSKSYATEANLVRGLERLGLTNVECRYIVCRTLDGRYTAVFLVSEWSNNWGGGYVGFAAEHGFMSV